LIECFPLQTITFVSVTDTNSNFKRINSCSKKKKLYIQLKAGHVARMGEKRNACRILVGKPEGMDIREIGWGGMDWIDLAQDSYQWRALVNTVMNFRVP
jgi:hypothetical protein